MSKSPHHLYTCTAAYGPTPAATPAHPHLRPTLVPGPFRVLELGQ